MFKSRIEKLEERIKKLEKHISLLESEQEDMQAEINVLYENEYKSDNAWRFKYETDEKFREYVDNDLYFLKIQGANKRASHCQHL